MTRPLLRLAALAIAVPATLVAAAAWWIADPAPPGEELYGRGVGVVRDLAGRVVARVRRGRR